MKRVGALRPARSCPASPRTRRSRGARAPQPPMYGPIALRSLRVSASFHGPARGRASEHGRKLPRGRAPADEGPVEGPSRALSPRPSRETARPLGPVGAGLPLPGSRHALHPLHHTHDNTCVLSCVLLIIHMYKQRRSLCFAKLQYCSETPATPASPEDYPCIPREQSRLGERRLPRVETKIVDEMKIFVMIKL